MAVVSAITAQPEEVYTSRSIKYQILVYTWIPNRNVRNLRSFRLSDYCWQ